MVTKSNRNFTQRIRGILPFSRCSRFSFRKRNPERPAETNVLNGPYKKSHFFTVSNLGGISNIFKTNFDRTQQIRSIRQSPIFKALREESRIWNFVHISKAVSQWAKKWKISGIKIGFESRRPLPSKLFYIMKLINIIQRESSKWQSSRHCSGNIVTCRGCDY
jgi:hypothetical protein